MNRAECTKSCLPVASCYSESAFVILNRRNIGIIKSCIRRAVRQMVFTDVLIVGQLDVDGHSFSPIGLHKTDAASDWLLLKHHCTDRKGLPGVELQN